MKLTVLIADTKGATAHVLKEMGEAKAKEIGIEPILFPENGVHPQFQMDIADDILKKGEDAVLITHSENIILRVMRRIRNGDISNKDISLLQTTRYVNNPDRGFAYFKELPLDEEGEFIGYMSGFFEQGYEERFDLSELSSIKSS